MHEIVARRVRVVVGMVVLSALWVGSAVAVIDWAGIPLESRLTTTAALVVGGSSAVLVSRLGAHWIMALVIGGAGVAGFVVAALAVNERVVTRAGVERAGADRWIVIPVVLVLIACLAMMTVGRIVGVATGNRDMAEFGPRAPAVKAIASAQAAAWAEAEEHRDLGRPVPSASRADRRRELIRSRPRRHGLGSDRDLAERYSRAVEQIGSEDKAVRIGGIHALERFAIDAARSSRASDTDWSMALDVLAVFAREFSAEARADAVVVPRWAHAPPPNMAPVPFEDGSTSDTAAVPPPPTVVEAVTVLGRFKERADLDRDQVLWHNLAGVIVRGIDLRGADLSGADLRGADLSGADLRGANLSRSILRDAYLSGSNLSRADVTAADLRGADLSSTCLHTADISRSNFEGAVLSRSDLHGAVLERTVLNGAVLSGAVFSGANLAKAMLRETDVSKVIHDDATRWPEGYEPLQPSGHTAEEAAGE